MNTKYVKIIPLLFWALLIGLIVYYQQHSGISISDYPHVIMNRIDQLGWIAPIVYIVFFIFRPLVFLPVSILTILSGVVFGPIPGIIYTLIGQSLSGIFSYLLGKYFIKDLVLILKNKNKRLKAIDAKFYDNGFIAIFIMRLLFFPYDLVGYVSGAFDIKLSEFSLATSLGIIPSVATWVLLGSAFSNPAYLALSAFFLIAGILISRILKKRSLPHHNSDKPRP